jgi:hypothetical protein
MALVGRPIQSTCLLAENCPHPSSPRSVSSITAVACDSWQTTLTAPHNSVACIVHLRAYLRLWITYSRCLGINSVGSRRFGVACKLVQSLSSRPSYLHVQSFRDWTRFPAMHDCWQTCWSSCRQLTMNPFIHRQAATDNIHATIRMCYSAAAGYNAAAQLHFAYATCLKRQIVQL